jgi:predicted Zn-dependent peptidase
MITAGEVLNAKGTEDLIALRTANDVIGGFLGRINLNLRENKGWAYSTGSGVNERIDRLLIRLIAPVQTDKTGAAIAEIRKELQGFLGADGVRPEELVWSTQSNARELPGMFETSGAVLEGIAKIVNFKRPDDYFVSLPARYKAMTAADINKAARAAIDPAKFVWVVVGDASKVRPQLDPLGLPVEIVKAGG